MELEMKKTMKKKNVDVKYSAKKYEQEYKYVMCVTFGNLGWRFTAGFKCLYLNCVYPDVILRKKGSHPKKTAAGIFKKSGQVHRKKISSKKKQRAIIKKKYRACILKKERARIEKKQRGEKYFSGHVPETIL